MEYCPEGCKLCIQGKKVAVHITYRCTKHCLYCPIPDEKFDTDIIEFQNKTYKPSIENVNMIIDVISRMNTIEGISISGGEPLLSIDYVYIMIRELKKRRGEKFHIHLYTNGDLLTSETICMLGELGLDELRVDSLEPSTYKNLKNARFSVICEVPCIPTETFFLNACKLIDISSAINLYAINLNEFEVTKENLNFVKRNELIFNGNKLTGCDIYAKRIIEYAKLSNESLKVFFCSYEIAERIRISRNRICDEIGNE